MEVRLMISAPIGGVLSHLLYFKSGEHHMSGPWIAATVPAIWFALTAARVPAEGFLEAVKYSNVLFLLYGPGLFGSIVTYRLFFHPLHSFPGPVLARVTKFWHVAQLGNLKNHVLLDDLHKKYGDVVRSGPNEIVVFRADGVAAVHGPGSKCTKAPWYDMLQKDRSMHATRKPSLHHSCRRIWNRGFSIKALARYQSRVNAKVELLRQNIAHSLQRPVECNRKFLYFGFDVMGDIAFGEGFGMLESNKAHPVMKITQSGIYIVGKLTPVSWLVTILASLPGANADFEMLENFGRESALRRIQTNRDDDEDVMSKLIEAARDPNDKEKIDMHWLTGDSMTIIIAGSETVAASLTFMFARLATHYEYVDILRKELESVSVTDNNVLQRLPYLNAVINETMRLHPPIPSAPLRLTPPEGLTIGDHLVPGHTTISTPVWHLGRLESSYERAHEFVPERWLPDSKIMKNRNGFAPFLTGPYSCVGKQLALLEMRLVTAMMVTNYEFAFAEGFTASQVFDLQDCFTANPGPLKLVFKKRGV